MQKYNNNSPLFRHGFSLIELAVVLAIMALVAGGVIVGGDMIESANLRKIPVQATQYSSAILSFNKKYNAYPGDMPDAVQIWGNAEDDTFVGNCTNPESDVSTTSITATCNGNGDGTIARAAGDLYETFRAWQHLKNADMLDGRYTGIAGSGGVQQVLGGENSPEGVLDRSAYDITYIPTTIPAGYFTGLDYSHSLHFGEEQTGNNFAREPILSAANAYEIDKKIDDSLPATGKIVTFNNTIDSTCASTDVSTTAIYQRINNSGEDCAFIFITGF